MVFLFAGLDVKHSALEDCGASFGNGDGGATSAIVVTDATIGVLGEEHFAIVVGVGNRRVGGSTGGGVSDEEWVDGSCRFVAGCFRCFGV